MTDASAGSVGLRWVFSLLLVITVFGCGLAGSASIVLTVQHQHREHLSQIMDQRAQAVGDAVSGEVERYTDTISDLAVAVGAQTDLSAQDFLSLTSRLNRQRLPGVSGALFTVPATHGQIPGVQQRWRAAGNSALTLVPFAAGPEHLFTVLGLSLDGTPTVTGRDVTQAKEPTLALLLARSRGQVAISATYILLKDRELPVSEQQLSFVLVAPVYGGSGTLDSGRFRGWILMGLRGGDFLVEAMTQVSQKAVAVSLFDASTSRGEAVSVARTGTAALINDESLRRTIALDIGGRAWQVLVQPTDRTKALAGPSPTLAAGTAGVIGTLLLTALVGALATSRTRALLRVDRATTALQADLRRRELVEDELREREVELRAFAGVVAHDLKSPLTNLIGYSTILTEEHADEFGAPASGYLAKISTNADRMWSLIDDLLSYTTARDATLTRVPVDLNDLLHDVITERCDTLAEPPHIEAETLPIVDADPVLLRQVLDNLIGNAVKYVRLGDIPNIHVTTTATAWGWRIEVSDRGIGIDDRDQALVFGTFNRARGSEDYPGTGLGLAICQRIIHRHDGQIGVSHNPGGGSLFWFTLPASITTTTPAPPAQSPPEASIHQVAP